MAEPCSISDQANSLCDLPSYLETRWYAIRTRYRFEQKVTDQLRSKGMETYLPLLEETHRWSDRRKAIRTPLFSGYTFAHLQLSAGSRLELVRTEGVLGLITFGPVAVPVPDHQIAEIQAVLSRGVRCSLHAFLQRGQRVRIRGGCLDGIEGILEQKDGEQLVISIEAIQRSIAIRIEGYRLELI